MDKILVLNSGSTSVKFQLIQMDNTSHQVLAKGLVDRIGLDGAKIVVKTENGNEFSTETSIPSRKSAIKMILDYLSKNYLKNASELSAVGHRMGHGREDFDCAAIINNEVMAKIHAAVPLMPLHGPAFIHGYEAVKELLPNVLQVATFDNSFHQSLDKEAFLYAIPREFYEKDRVRRYGFHGTSHQYCAKKAAEKLGYKGRFICCHMGGGISVTAIKNGKSVDTTMGYTPSSGIMMATRCGDMDPYIPLHIMKTQNKTPDEVDRMFNKECGLYALSGGHSDMRDILDNAKAGDENCKFAIDSLIYQITKYIGSYIAELGGIDALIFTAGIGENSPEIRQRICEKLAFTGLKLDSEKNSAHPAPTNIEASDSQVKVLVIPANEELMIAEETYDLLEEFDQNKVEAI